MQWLGISNQVAIITGAASGIGMAVARALAQQNCSLILSDLNSSVDQLKQLEMNIKEHSHSSVHVRSFTCNVTQRDQVTALIRAADELAASVAEKNRNNNIVQRASLLINSAGTTRDRVIQDMTDEDFDSVINVNLKGTFLTCQGFCSPHRLRHILTHRCNTGASIVNVGSIISQTGNIGQTNYAASKGGVVGLTRALAKEMAFYSTRLWKEQHRTDDADSSLNQKPPSIRINCILPGFIDTPMTQEVPSHIRQSIQQKIALHHRMGHPDDVANLALFLASSVRSGYITGQTFECSGMLAL